MTMKRDYHRDYSKSYYHERMTRYKQQLGGKCKQCGTTNDLEFDHIDQSTKLFSIGQCMNHSEEKVQLELSKCQLLCEACHKDKSITTTVYEDRHKLTIAEAKAIRTTMIRDNISIRKAALRFNLNRATVTKIFNGVYATTKI